MLVKERLIPGASQGPILSQLPGSWFISPPPPSGTGEHNSEQMLVHTYSLLFVIQFQCTATYSLLLAHWLTVIAGPACPYAHIRTSSLMATSYTRSDSARDMIADSDHVLLSGRDASLSLSSFQEGR